MSGWGVVVSSAVTVVDWAVSGADSDESASCGGGSDWGCGSVSEYGAGYGVCAESDCVDCAAAVWDCAADEVWAAAGAYYCDYWDVESVCPSDCDASAVDADYE